MKLKTFLIILLLPTLLNNCVTETPMFNATYQIKNESGNSITIRFYENFILNENNFEDVILPNNQIISGSKTMGTNFDDLNNLNNTQPTTSFSALSFTAVYNNERKTEYFINFSDTNDSYTFSSPVNRNLLRGGNYTNIGNDIYEFILTEEDYNNATPCSGDCLD